MQINDKNIIFKTAKTLSPQITSKPNITSPSPPMSSTLSSFKFSLTAINLPFHLLSLNDKVK